MMNSGGDGGLNTIIEIKEFIRVNMDIDNMPEAQRIAKALKDHRAYQRDTVKANGELLPELETSIASTKDGKFIVWYRDCI